MKRLICISGGKLQFEEVKNPSISGVGVVTKTVYSAISSGTEGDWVREMIDSKRSEPRILGYSTSGIVIEKHKDMDFVEVGDKVACVGSVAMHATHNFTTKFFLLRLQIMFPFVMLLLLE